MIYLDNAATTGVKPRIVLDAVNNCLVKYSVNPSRGGYTQSIKASEMVFDCRRKLKEFFNASSESNICRVEDELDELIIPKKKAIENLDLLLYFAAALVALVILERWLQAQDM